MKKIAALVLSLIPFFLISQTSIYEIQHTTIAGDGSYPSLYEGSNGNNRRHCDCH